MECGKLTAKLRDAVPVCFMVNDREVKRYKNIEIPAEIKHLEYCGFRFDVPEDGGVGWVQDGGNYYYFLGSGAMATGWQEIDGQWEMFGDDGVWQYTWDGN